MGFKAKLFHSLGSEKKLGQIKNNLNRVKLTILKKYLKNIQNIRVRKRKSETPVLWQCRDSEFLIKSFESSLVIECYSSTGIFALKSSLTWQIVFSQTVAKGPIIISRQIFVLYEIDIFCIFRIFSTLSTLRGPSGPYLRTFLEQILANIWIKHKCFYNSVKREIYEKLNFS